MEITWDERKREANRFKHRLDFADLDESFFENALVLPTDRANRWKGIGRDAAGIISVVFAKLGREGISVISMRPASRKERSLYRATL